MTWAFSSAVSKRKVDNQLAGVANGSFPRGQRQAGIMITIVQGRPYERIYRALFVDGEE